MTSSSLKTHTSFQPFLQALMIPPMKRDPRCTPTSPFTSRKAFGSLNQRANMKTNLLSLITIFTLLAVTGCKKSPSADQSANAPQEKSASSRPGFAGTAPFEGGRKTSFQEVTSQL